MSDFQKIEGDNWNNWEVSQRLGFVRKVYGILGTQLSLTAFTCALPMIAPETASYFRHPAVFYTSLVMQIVLTCALFCVRSLSRTVPINYILLFMFTMAESHLVSAICTLYDPQTVFMAASMTAALVVGLTLYAMTTKTDFTFMYSFGVSFLVCMLSMSLFLIFSAFNMRIIYCAFGVLLFSIYLIADTQMIVGNYGLDYDDYILGAIMLYVDIIQIFLYILRLLGNKN